MLLPKMYPIRSIVHETPEIFTFVLSKNEKTEGTFLPGQFNMLFLFGYGEIPISISGDPQREDTLVHTIKAVGSVTEAMQRLKAGDEIGVRGPFGTSWPLGKEGEDILLIAGGVGLASLSSILYYFATHRQQYNRITLLYGARRPQDLFYKNEIFQWRKEGIEVTISVDEADEHWQGERGTVTSMIGRHLPRPKNTQAYLCGPEIMIQKGVEELLRTKINQQSVYISMERNMHCAVGFCGHCLYGPYFMCKDGPVFSYTQLKPWLTIREL